MVDCTDPSQWAQKTRYFLKTFYSGVPEVLMPTSLTTYYCARTPGS